jgi:predicted alpha/beta hydrolase
MRSLETASVHKEDVTFTTKGGAPLAGTLYTGNGTGPCVMISCATAVPHTYYRHFAVWLVEQGVRAAFTYDYSGIGGSRIAGGTQKGIGYREWAFDDFVSAFYYFQSRVPSEPIVGLGHSFGGHALGLSGIANEFARFCTVGTLSGYWRGTNSPISILFQAKILLPVFAHLFDGIPRRFSPGEPLPRQVALDWSRWMGMPDYFFSDPHLPETERFSGVTIPILSIGLEDDDWGPRTAVEPFMAHYSNADARQIWLEPGASGPIGHLGLFRRAHRETHWRVARDFLLKETWPEGAYPL